MARQTHATPLRDTFGVVVEPRTYTNLAYLALSVPLGLAYFAFLSFGFGFGGALAPFVVGIPMIAAVVLASRPVAGFERRLARRLLGVAVKGEGFAGTDLLAPLGAISTWKSVVFLSVKVWIGVAAVTVGAVTLGTSVALLTAPLHYANPNVGFVGVSLIDTPTRAIAAVPVGVLATVVSLHVMNGVARVAGYVAVALLDEK